MAEITRQEAIEFAGRDELRKEMNIPEPGYVEEIPKGARGYGKYKYRVMGRIGYPVHHTNSKDDADWYLGECRKTWAAQPAPTEGEG